MARRMIPNPVAPLVLIAAELVWLITTPGQLTGALLAITLLLVIPAYASAGNERRAAAEAQASEAGPPAPVVPLPRRGERPRQHRPHRTAAGQ